MTEIQGEEPCPVTRPGGYRWSHQPKTKSPLEVVWGVTQDRVISVDVFASIYAHTPSFYWNTLLHTVKRVSPSPGPADLASIKRTYLQKVRKITPQA